MMWYSLQKIRYPTFQGAASFSSFWELNSTRLQWIFKHGKLVIFRYNRVREIPAIIGISQSPIIAPWQKFWWKLCAKWMCHWLTIKQIHHCGGVYFLLSSYRGYFTTIKWSMRHRSTTLHLRPKSRQNCGLQWENSVRLSIMLNYFKV